MSSTVLTQAMDGVTQAAFGQGRIFNLLAAPAGPVTFTLDRRSPNGGQTQNRKFANVPAGTKYVADKGDEWTYLRVDSAFVQVIQLFVGDEDMQFNNAVTITGSAAVTVNPASLITDAAPIVCPTAALTAIVATNAARRRVTLSADPANTGTVWIRKAGGANNLLPLQPGTFIEFDGTYALSVQNSTGANQTVYTFEET